MSSSAAVSRLEINMNALKNNLGVMRSIVGNNRKIMGVVKANAYGHGMVNIAKNLQDLGIDYLAVAYGHEGVELRKQGVKVPILILHAQLGELGQCIDNELEPVIYSMDFYFAFAKIAHERSLRDYKVHVEFNTGMNRLGLEPTEAPQIIERLLNNPNLKLRGLMSHLAGSEEAELDEFTQCQIEKFKSLNSLFSESFKHEFYRHISNSSGALNHSDGFFDMVRCGISLYGYSNDPSSSRNLIPIATLISRISLIRKVKKGESISYNRKFYADEDLLCAVVAAGHGDGYTRRYAGSSVLVNGKLAPILGVVNMDMFMIDVSNIDCQVGDEVILIGPELPASTVAERAGTISYELLTNISSRVERVSV